MYELMNRDFLPTRNIAFSNAGITLKYYLRSEIFNTTKCLRCLRSSFIEYDDFDKIIMLMKQNATNDISKIRLSTAINDQTF